MHRSEPNCASPAASATAQHLATLVKQARHARRWTLAELAERSRISLATTKRIEAGAVSVSLSAWLAVFERLGLLARLDEIRDPASQALVDATRQKRVRKSSKPNDLDF